MFSVSLMAIELLQYYTKKTINVLLKVIEWFVNTYFITRKAMACSLPGTTS